MTDQSPATLLKNKNLLWLNLLGGGLVTLET
jgi:hypothetical protein